LFFHIFPLRQHLVAHKSQSHPSAYTRDSCGILLCQPIHPCHVAAQPPPQTIPSRHFPNAETALSETTGKGGGHRTGKLVRVERGAAAGRPATLVGMPKSGGLPLTINTGTCEWINPGGLQRALHGAPRSRVNRSVEADLARDPMSPGNLDQKTGDVPAVILVGQAAVLRTLSKESGPKGSRFAGHPVSNCHTQLEQWSELAARRHGLGFCSVPATTGFRSARAIRPESAPMHKSWDGASTKLGADRRRGVLADALGYKH